ncbi:MAG: hypothetical protein RSB10_02905 [Clostridia bacterium]
MLYNNCIFVTNCNSLTQQLPPPQATANYRPTIVANCNFLQLNATRRNRPRYAITIAKDLK